jgi:outer membrane protein
MRVPFILAAGAAMFAAVPAQAEAGDWIVRLRAIVVAPNEKTGTVQPSFATSHTSVNDSVAPELDFTYMWTKHVGTELILATTKHHVSGRDALAPVGRLASTWVLPPTLTLQYHFTGLGAFKPYVGAGINYTDFFNQSAANTPVGGLAVTDLHISNQVGAAVQFGFDYMLDRHWGLNVDVKKLWLRPDYSATVNNTIPVTGRANIDPWLVGGGVTYKF